MSRSERYIPLSAKELERRRQVIEATERFDTERRELLKAALKGLKKADVVELTLRIAADTKVSEWLLESEVELDKPVDLLVHDTEVAVDIATQVDELRMNYNFAFDYDAYEAVRRGISQLLRKGEIEAAKAIALKLIRKGSAQIECSDEGLMKDEIESCLRMVISAVAKSTGGRDFAWEMLAFDQVGFLCRSELLELVEQPHHDNS